LAIVLVALGAALPSGEHSDGHGSATPSEIRVRVAVLDPSTGAVIWSSASDAHHVTLNATTGRVTSTG
jgi:hypothetical protein